MKYPTGSYILGFWAKRQELEDGYAIQWDFNSAELTWLELEPGSVSCELAARVGQNTYILNTFTGSCHLKYVKRIEREVRGCVLGYLFHQS